MIIVHGNESGYSNSEHNNDNDKQTNITHNGNYYNKSNNLNNNSLYKIYNGSKFINKTEAGHNDKPGHPTWNTLFYNSQFNNNPFIHYNHSGSNHFHNLTILNQTNSTQHIVKHCDICTELLNSIKSLFVVIKKLELEFKMTGLKKYTRQEQIIVLTNWLNFVNLIKTILYKINEIKESLDPDQCTSLLEQNGKYMTSINNFVSQLVDILQKTIRQQNLNLSLIILT
jgi:hypothetical protein